MSINDNTIKPSLITVVVRIAFFTLVWLALAEGRLDSLWVGGVAILVSAYLSTKLIPGLSINVVALVPFLFFFIWRSLLGGIDVARRVLNRRLKIDPRLIVFSCRLEDDIARAFFINTVNLLPGTLVISVEHNDLHIHVLDKNVDNESELKQVESKIAKILKINIHQNSQE